MNDTAPMLRVRRCAVIAALALAMSGVCSHAMATITCSITSSAMSFGNYDPSGASATDGTGSVVVSCYHNSSGSNSVNITLAIGAGTYGTFAARKMQKSSGQQLSYNLYRDSARTQIWGTGSGGYSTVVISTTISNNSSKSKTFTVYGRIPAQQNVPAGVYTDSVVITVTP